MPELLGDYRLEVGIGEVHLAVRQLLETGEGGVEGVSLGHDAELLQGVGEGVAAGVLAEHDLPADLAHRGGVDDLIGRALREHPVLVDARLVGEGVLAHDRLVPLHLVAGEPRDHPARAGQLLGADARLQTGKLVADGS